MSKDQFYERVSISVISSMVKYEASVNINGRQYICEGSSSDEAKENLWEYLVDEIGI